MAKPNVVLDARLYGIAHKGIGRYTAALAEALSAHHADFTFTALAGKDGAALVLREKGWRVVEAPYAPYTWQEQWYIPRLLRQLGCQVYHAPHFNVPVRCPVPYVLTIHDLILHEHPNRRASTRGAAQYWFKYAAYRLVFRHVVQKASGLIAVTEFVAEDLRTRFPSTRTLVQVIGEIDHNTSTDNKTKVPYTNDTPYVVTVGAFYPHKNIERLLRVWGDVYRQTNVTLLLIGKIDSFGARLRASVSESDGVRFMGEVDDTDLIRLQQGAKCALVPSLYEGYGLPGREAAQVSTSVFSSAFGALPEVYGRGALYLPVGDDAHLRNALLRSMAATYSSSLPAMPPAETVESLGMKWADVYRRLYEISYGSNRKK